MTESEKLYMQIEMGMLAIIFLFEHFYQYTFGHHVSVESDYKPLEVILQKLLSCTTWRLQSIMMMLQKYGFTVCYERGKNMHLANMLLQAFLPFEGDDEDHLKFMNMVSYLPISNKCIDEMNAKTWRAYPKSSSRVGQKKRNLPVN